MHAIVNVKNNTIELMSICPYKNVINWSNSDKFDKLVTIYGIHVDPNTNANVIIPAIIGDSVRLDANIPNDIYVIESSINPNIDVKYIDTFGISK